MGKRSAGERFDVAGLSADNEDHRPFHPEDIVQAEIAIRTVVVLSRTEASTGFRRSEKGDTDRGQRAKGRGQTPAPEEMIMHPGLSHPPI